MNNPMTYIQNGDYLIPDLKLSQQRSKPLGKYGRMRKNYLKKPGMAPHRPPRMAAASRQTNQGSLSMMAQ